MENLQIQNNKFTFEDIEPNVGVPSDVFTYSPQDSVGESRDTTIIPGSSFTMSVSLGGISNQYQWKKDGTAITGATDTFYIISSANIDDAGSYICEITNTVATALTLYSRPTTISLNSAVPELELPGVYSLEIKRITANKNLELRYTLPEKAILRLSVYDLTGKVLKEFSKEEQPGTYSRKIAMQGKPMGVYFIRMEANGKKFTKTDKVVLLK